jgi:hypothetical protein
VDFQGRLNIQNADIIALQFHCNIVYFRLHQLLKHFLIKPQVREKSDPAGGARLAGKILPKIIRRAAGIDSLLPA